VSDLLASLNPPQREAVLTEEGPLLVLAGAGSGKTRVLTHRIAHLVRQGLVPPEGILAITFTNKAAGEMRERLDGLVGPGARALWASTFHSACVRILRREAPRVGYERDFSIFDEADAMRVLRLCYEDLQVDPKRFPARAVMGRISDAKNNLLTPDDLAERTSGFFEDKVVLLYRRYADRLRANGGMDFDDLLMLTVEILESDAEARERYRRRFEHVMVDEYQDTNHAQYRLVRVLAEPRRNVMVVGDDDQGIYSWRGADVRNILDRFEKDYPEARVIALEQNYRSTGTILRAANAVVARNRHRHPKRLWTEAGDGEPILLIPCRDEHEEARAAAGEIRRAIDDGRSHSEIGVFYRTNAQSRVIEDTLVRDGVPYQVIGGPKFYERAEIRDVLAYLRVAANPADAVSFARMVATPRRGIGPGCVARLAEHAAAHEIRIADAAAQADMVPELRPAQRRALADVAALLDELRRLDESGASVDRILEEALDGSGLRAALAAERTIESLGRLENLDELVVLAAEYQGRAEEPSLGGFLEEIALYADADDVDPGAGRVTLMTIHNAKGLEFDVVMIVGLEEGIFPHQRSDTPEALEEERRLFYVGLTRARQRLVLAYAGSRAMHGGRDYRLPSRFLGELPADALREPGPAMAAATARSGGGSWGRSGRGAARGAPDLQTGDSVLHATFGEGIITGVEQGGELVRVRFPDAERRLIAASAPMRKVMA
jgi:DNA helicase-2/ATP-dependent DNA helicase PcrA